MYLSMFVATIVVSVGFFFMKPLWFLLIGAIILFFVTKFEGNGKINKIDVLICLFVWPYVLLIHIMDFIEGFRKYHRESAKVSETFYERMNEGPDTPYEMFTAFTTCPGCSRRNKLVYPRDDNYYCTKCGKSGYWSRMDDDGENFEGIGDLYWFWDGEEEKRYGKI